MKRSPFSGSLLAMGAMALLSAGASVRVRDDEPDIEPIEGPRSGGKSNPRMVRDDTGFLERQVSAAVGRLPSQAEMARTRKPLDFDPKTGLQKASVKTMSNRQRKLYEASLRRRARQHKEG